MKIDKMVLTVDVDQSEDIKKVLACAKLMANDCEVRHIEFTFNDVWISVSPIANIYMMEKKYNEIKEAGLLDRGIID